MSSAVKKAYLISSIIGAFAICVTLAVVGVGRWRSSPLNQEFSCNRVIGPLEASSLNKAEIAEFRRKNAKCSGKVGQKQPQNLLTEEYLLQESAIKGDAEAAKSLYSYYIYEKMNRTMSEYWYKIYDERIGISNNKEENFWSQIKDCPNRVSIDEIQDKTIEFYKEAYFYYSYCDHQDGYRVYILENAYNKFPNNIYVVNELNSIYMTRVKNSERAAKMQKRLRELEVAQKLGVTIPN